MLDKMEMRLMKKIVIVAMLLITMQIAFASLPTIIISGVDPQPVEPGKDVTLDVTLFNKLTTDTGDFAVELQTQNPIILKSSSRDLSTVNLCSGCKQENTYFLTIDSRAVSGTYPVYVKALAGNLELREQVDIKVQGRPNVIFSVSSKGLGNVTPNSQFSVILEVNNAGTGQARQLKIQPDSTNFIVIGNPLKTLDILDASQNMKINFDFVAAAALEATSYVIPFKISYLDYQGNVINSTQSIGLNVVNKGEINIQGIKIASSAGASQINKANPFTVVVRLENIGSGDADSIVADIACPFNGPKKAFLGQLKKDEDSPAVFELTSPDAGIFTCDLMVAFVDDMGSHELSEKFDVTIAEGDSPLGIVIVVLLIAGVFIFRKRIFLKKK